MPIKAALVLALLWTGTPVWSQPPQSRDRQGAGTSPLEQIAALAEQAEIDFRQQELEKAESRYRQALGIALDQLGTLHSLFRDYSKAERAYQEAIRASVNANRPLIGLSIVYLRTGQYEKGMETVRRILQFNVTHSEARHILGKLYFMMGRFESAAHELRDAYTASPHDTSVAYTLALAYLKRKKVEEARKIFSEMIQQLGDSPQLRVLLGRAYRETDYLSEAVEEFKKAVELDAHFPRAHYYLGLTYLLQQGASAFPAAIQEFEVELERNAQEFFANFYLGVLHVQNRHHKKAIPYLQTAVQLDSDNPDPYLYLGQAFFQSGDYRQAAAALSRSIELTSNPSRGNYQLGNTHYMLAQSLMRLGSRKEAEKHLKLAQEYKSKRSEAEAANLQAYIEGKTPGPESMGTADFALLAKSTEPAVILEDELPDPQIRAKLEGAAESYRKAAAVAYRNVARVAVHYSPPRFDRAVEWLQKALFWDDSLADVRYNLALAQVRSGQFQEAVRHLKQILDGNPEKQEAKQLMANLGLLLVEKGVTGPAAEAVDFLLEQNPEVPDLYLLRGQIFAQEGQFARALEQFRNALGKNPSLREAHYYSGTVLIRQGKLDEALQELDRELRLNPDPGRALYHKAFIHISHREMDAAVPLLERALRLDPNYADAYYQLGKVQVEKGQLIQGIANLETAGNLDPSKSYIFYQLSQAYTKTGRREHAEKALARYRELKKEEEAARFRK